MCWSLHWHWCVSLRPVCVSSAFRVVYYDRLATHILNKSMSSTDWTYSVPCVIYVFSVVCYDLSVRHVLFLAMTCFAELTTFLCVLRVAAGGIVWLLRGSASARAKSWFECMYNTSAWCSWCQGCVMIVRRCVFRSLPSHRSVKATTYEHGVGVCGSTILSFAGFACTKPSDDSLRAQCNVHQICASDSAAAKHSFANTSTCVSNTRMLLAVRCVCVVAMCLAV